MDNKSFNLKFIPLVLILSLILSGSVRGQFKVPGYNSTDLLGAIILHLSGIEDLSTSGAFFGLSKFNADIATSTISLPGGNLSFSDITGEFVLGKNGDVRLIPFDVDVVETSTGLGDLASLGLTIEQASFKTGEVNFITVRFSTAFSAGVVFEALFDAVPVLKPFKNSPFVQKTVTVLENISGSLGGTGRIDILPITDSNPTFGLRLATSIDKSLSGTGDLGKGFKVGLSGAKVTGRAVQLSIWHIEALTETRFPDEVRALFSRNYNVFHPNYNDVDLNTLDIDDFSFPENSDIILKGTGNFEQPISISSNNSSTISFTPGTGVDSDIRIALEMDTGKNSFFGSFGDLSGTIGVAPFDIEEGTFSFGKDPVVSDFIQGTNIPDFDGSPLPVVASAIPLLDSYDGVDFTNLEVMGLDVDQTTKAVNFILRGDRENATGPIKLNNESKLLKSVFVEALTIPNNAQFVSLETNPPEAVAYEPFKHTEMGQIFFIADEQMKKDFAEKVYVNPGGKNIIQEWYDRLAAVNSPSNFLKNILARDVIPDIAFNIRANIVPVIPTGNKENDKVFIEDSNYNIVVSEAFATLTLTNANGGGITISTDLQPGTVGITLDEFNILSAELNDFNSFIINRTLDKRNSIRNDINNGVGVYKNLKRILPAIVAAHWYKQSGLAEGTLKDIIDTGDLTNRYTGRSLSKPFDQTLWDSKAQQLLATLEASSVGYTVTSSITGGVTINNNVNPNKLDDDFKNVQQVIFDESLADGFNADDYVNAGGVAYRIAEIVPTGIFMRPNADNFVGFNAGFLENRPVTVAIGVANNGNKRANNLQVNVYMQRENGQPVNVESTIISRLDPYETKSHMFSFNPGVTGNGLLTENIKLFYRVNENESVPELSYTNNELDIEMEIAEVLYHEVLYDRFYQFDLKSQSRNFFASHDFAFYENTTIRDGVKLSAHSPNRVVLMPGFKAENGSEFRAWIGDDLEAREEYDRLNPAPSNTANKASFSKVSKPDITKHKAPKLARDHRLDNLRSKNLDDTNFLPVFMNYEIIDENAIGKDENALLSSLYPNPVVDFVSLDLNFAQDRNISIDLYTISGTKVKNLKENVHIAKGSSTLSLDLSNISSGIYMLVLREGDKKLDSKLVLKNR
ncbi:MAG: T9SS type A sorting domain-containing protein [Bacteroidota bacterium]